MPTSFCSCIFLNFLYPLAGPLIGEAKNFSESLAPNQLINQTRFQKKRIIFLRRQVTIVALRREHFRDFFADFLLLNFFQKRGRCNTQEFTCFLPTGVVLVSSRAVTCPFKQSNPSVWSLFSWHPTHTHLWVRLSVLLKVFVSTGSVPPSDSDYVNRSASLQPFRLIHKRRARRSRSARVDNSIRYWIVLFCERYWLGWRRRARLSTKHEVGRERYWRRLWILRENL